ncbi:hypothetical protein EZ449_03570 [Pedobacter frigidisoli]|uniref:Uncharacterized protein n=1 Tax=Pedobacter frigidisoli TaxID=2530455 RepID=A0A4V2MNB3_9SPHI|nr:hypothetical protein [Pedobacter frigidisoli]TCD12108.1 hypothetical protein EZ449_03570 [Pedobacter frigidisoli]
MKTKIFIWAVFLVSGFISKLYAQDFYPGNLRSIVYTDKNNEIKINDFYVNKKGFLWLNDSTYAKKDLSELIQVTSKNTDKFLEVRVDYYLKNNNLERFINRTANRGLDKTGVDKFEKTDKEHYYKIEVKRGVLFDNRKYNLIGFTQRDEVNVAKQATNKKPENKFDYNSSYPFQNTSWYLDTKKVDIKNKYEDKSKYIISLAEDKTSDVKIEFLDDTNFKLTFGPPQKKQILTGNYKLYSHNMGSGYKGVYLSINNPPKKPKTKPGYKEAELIINYADTPKNTENYFRFWLGSFDFELKLENGNRISLTRDAYNNPPIDLAPASIN